jgi:histidine triad (HIT) family protein
VSAAPAPSPASEGCIFCRIVRGEAPANRVYEDAGTLAFLDLFPAEEGHTLVITKEHFANVFEATEESLVRVMATARRVAPALRDAMRPAGLRVIQLNGEAAGQTVFHYHLHLIPCGLDGAMRVHGRRQGDPARLAEIAAAIARRIEPAGARPGG